jgi:hypothetical protein
MVPNSQTLFLGQSHLDLQNPGVCDCGEVRCISYRTVRLGTPAKLKNLHGTIGRRVDLARVRYGTMQSESMRARARRRRGVRAFNTTGNQNPNFVPGTPRIGPPA